jgi:hypothetical protein
MTEATGCTKLKSPFMESLVESVELFLGHDGGEDVQDSVTLVVAKLINLARCWLRCSLGW